MIYDCRREPEQGSKRFPGPVVIKDSLTGERIPNVFFLDTVTGRVGRFVTDAAGQPLVDVAKRKRIVEGGRCKIVHERLEIWETRQWVALTPDGKEVIARSHERTAERSGDVG